jgi:hypothetical protein
MHGRQILRLAGVGIALVALGTGCGHATSVDVRSRKAARPAARPAGPPAYSTPNGSFSVDRLPPSFRAWRDQRHGEGPVPGTSFDAQDFLSESAQQKFTVSVHRGISVGILTDTERFPNPAPSARKVQGRETFSAFNGISLQREIIWVVDPSTLAYVIGNEMTDDDLFFVAEGVRVSL